MISRRRIIYKSEDSSSSSSCSTSSSSDNLNKDETYDSNDQQKEQNFLNQPDENTWSNIQQLINDQLEEVRNKWNQIDDEIWAKIICFERNRRVAKAYARSQVISINGSERAFDGYRIGLNGFPNPKRDYEVPIIKQQIRSGLKLKIDDMGNVYIKRVGRCQVFCGSFADELSDNMDDNENENSISTATSLEMNKANLLFDFKKYQQNMLNSLIYQQTRQNPNDLKSVDLDDKDLIQFQNQCVHFIQLVIDEKSNWL